MPRCWPGSSSARTASSTCPALPVVAIVGRPNVGKSALVNRILGRREAVVEDTPGVTRDRVTYKAEWMARRFSLVDTGGWEPDARGIDASVAAQAEVAIDLCDVVLFVVDAMVGATSTDEHVVKLLRKSGKPVFLVANKIDDARHEPEAAALWNLGLGEPYPVSAIHGRGVADLLDEVMKVLPEISAVAKHEIGGPRRVAILGRPNVGKSSLLNKAAGEERVVVNELAGTTRDPVDEIVELGGKLWRFVDTAGIRRRVHLQQGADFYASLRTSAALEKAEVAVVVIDVSERSASRTCASSTSCSSRAAPSCSPSTSGTASPTTTSRAPTGAATSSARSSRTSRTSRGRRASTSRRSTGRHLERLVPALETALRVVGSAHPDGQVQRVPRRTRGRAPASPARRQAAPHPVRHAGGQPPADIRALHDRVPRPGLPPLRAAPPARAVRLRGLADRHQHARA